MNNKLLGKKKGVLVVLLGLMALGIGGCANKSNTDSSGFYGTYISPEQEKKLLAQTVYHFGFDSYEVSDKDILSIYAHAKRINCSNTVHVRIEGHTDERGSRGYNVALGERRARAVSNLLILKGVDSKKMTVVSYGKEKPMKSGHNEAAWRLNRRVVIVYEKK